jgi:GTP-binding protein EngB required for normal cell division
MSTWGTQKKNKISKFFTGSSIIKNSITSLYGVFVDTITNIFPEENENIMVKYKIPTVIVIGSESSGKSSLLENITKCPVFPRNAKICTKQPIHLKLSPALDDSDISYTYNYDNVDYKTTKNKISKDLREIMERLDHNSISDAVITVNICDKDLPHFEFIDLPGIRAYPENLAKSTYELAEKYILKSDTIILCVVPATTPRLTSYTPIALLKKHDKIKNTIIALTMCDRVQEENIFELIVERLVGSGDEFDNMVFAGCTAVINRNSDSITLCENNKREQSWFSENIIDVMPTDFEYSEKLVNNIGTDLLVGNIDNIYNNYIRSTWIPKTIENLEKDIERLNIELLNIGPKTIDCMTWKDVINRTNAYSFQAQSTKFTLFDCGYIYDDLVNRLIEDNLYFTEKNIENNYKCSSKDFINKIKSKFIDILNTIDYINFDRFTKSIYEFINFTTLENIFNETYKNIIGLLLSQNEEKIKNIMKHTFFKWLEDLNIDLTLMKEDDESQKLRTNIEEKIENANNTIDKLKNIN